MLAGCAAGAETSAAPQADAGATRAQAGAGVSVSRPRGWQLTVAPITALTFPAERLLLTSYPTRRGGNCGPDRAARDLPPGGALLYLFEYRPRRGDVWRSLRRRDFPPRPARFALRRDDLGSFECWRVPSYLIRFRAADRPFQLHVALGRNASAARRAQVLRVLDGMRFAALPAPPPDPYAGWRLRTDEIGDSIRIPPGWAAAATTAPRRYPRPRALFFTSNRRLPGLAPGEGRAARRLPGPFPTRALNAFADDGVLLWIREEPRGPASGAFERLPRRPWPRGADFASVRTGPAARWPRLRWERAAAAARRHRFAIWLVSGPAASDRDRGLARKAAAALALLTGAYRDRPCRRACRSG